MSDLRVLVATNMYPTESDPAYGAFVASQVQSLHNHTARIEVEFINGARGSWRYLSAIHRVRRLASSGKFDLVHAHYGLTGFVARFQPLPLVISFCGDDLLGTPDGRGGLTMKSRVSRALSRRAARRATAIICKSEQLRDALPDVRDRARAKVIPNGVDTALFFPGKRADARRRLGLDATERLVLFPHTPAERRKRFDVAEAAVRRLDSAGTPARLLMVAGVPHEAMPDYYRAADCLLLTSDWEGSPNVVKEALCCDLPVVTVDVGDVRRWLSLAPGCERVEPDPESIATGLARVLARRGLVDGNLVRAELALERIAAQIVEVYRDAMTHAR